MDNTNSRIAAIIMNSATIKNTGRGTLLINKVEPQLTGDNKLAT